MRWNIIEEDEIIIKYSSTASYKVQEIVKNRGGQVIETHQLVNAGTFEPIGHDEVRVKFLDISRNNIEQIAKGIIDHPSIYSAKTSKKYYSVSNREGVDWGIF